MTAAATPVPEQTSLFGLRLPDERGFTVADLHALPDDGLRYELIDGSIIVSPSATADHNTVARWIIDPLERSNPGDDYFVSIDQSATVDDHNVPRPDVVVAQMEHFQSTPFPITSLLLAVEVVSPYSGLRDTEIKRALYAKAGVPSFWIVVPDADDPTISLAELVLDEGATEYRFATHYTTEVFRTDKPWPVEIDLPALTERRARLLRRANPAG